MMTRRKAPPAWRLKFGGEFGAAVVVGALIGFGIDYYAHTSPWGVLIGIGLGFCAGVVNVMRTGQGPIPSGIQSIRTRRPFRTTKTEKSASPCPTTRCTSFHIERLVPFQIGNWDASFSNASLFMVAGVAAASRLHGRCDEQEGDGAGPGADRR